MDFNQFKNKIIKLENLPLPGVEAQHKLAPLIRIKEMERLQLNGKVSNEAGVMAVFYPNEKGITHLVLILRKTYKGVHSNQVGFPGGRVEPQDRDLEHTALRETEEEVGIPQNEVTVIKKLTKLYIPPSDFWVHPYLGYLEKTPLLVPQEEEVEEILEVDLEDFLNEKNLVLKKLSTSYSEEMEVPAFYLNGHIVWGATAMMLSELKDLLHEVL